MPTKSFAAWASAATASLSSARLPRSPRSPGYGAYDMDKKCNMGNIEIGEKENTKILIFLFKAGRYLSAVPVLGYTSASAMLTRIDAWTADSPCVGPDSPMLRFELLGEHM